MMLPVGLVLHAAVNGQALVFLLLRVVCSSLCYRGC